jgi:hypothetical protein
MTETTCHHPQRRVPLAKPCPVCASIEARIVDLGLAAGRSPRRLARSFKLLKAHQIRRHRDRCLGGEPLRAVAEKMGYELIEEPVIEEAKDG